MLSLFDSSGSRSPEFLGLCLLEEGLFPLLQIGKIKQADDQDLTREYSLSLQGFIFYGVFQLLFMIEIESMPITWIATLRLYQWKIRLMRIYLNLGKLFRFGHQHMR